MTTKDLANIDNMIELAEQCENAAKTIKNALILLRQAEEEDYLERTDNIKPVSVRLDEASKSMKQCEDRKIPFERMNTLIKENEEAERIMKRSDNYGD